MENKFPSSISSRLTWESTPARPPISAQSVFSDLSFLPRGTIISALRSHRDSIVLLYCNYYCQYNLWYLIFPDIQIKDNISRYPDKRCRKDTIIAEPGNISTRSAAPLPSVSTAGWSSWGRRARPPGYSLTSLNIILTATEKRYLHALILCYF